MIHLFEDLVSELENFLNDLNWTFILIYSFIIYGINHKSEFIWYTKLMKKTKLTNYQIWISGLFIMLSFILFRYLDIGVDSEYISTLLRSFIVVIVFNDLFSRNLNRFEKDK